MASPGGFPRSGAGTGGFMDTLINEKNNIPFFAAHNQEKKRAAIQGKKRKDPEIFHS